jgi:hypothetical protein
MFNGKLWIPLHQYYRLYMERPGMTGSLDILEDYIGLHRTTSISFLHLMSERACL